MVDFIIEVLVWLVVSSAKATTLILALIPTLPHVRIHLRRHVLTSHWVAILLDHTHVEGGIWPAHHHGVELRGNELIRVHIAWRLHLLL
jgi:hypothetical protein